MTEVRSKQVAVRGGTAKVERGWQEGCQRRGDV